MVPKASAYDVLVAPFIRDVDVLLPGYVFFFALQFALHTAAKRLLPRFNQLSKNDQLDWCVRGVAAINGLICQRSTYIWLSFLYNMPENFTYDMYTPLPGYRVSIALLVAYFMWDTTVCFYYRWSWAYTLHGIFSGVGMYLCMFPCSDLWSPYYSGLYELSNFFYHSGQMFRMVTDQSSSAPARNKVIPVVGEAFFVVWFFAVRLLGGLWTSTRWIKMMAEQIAVGEVHNEVTAMIMIGLFSTVIGIQVFWARDVYVKVRDSIFPTRSDAKIKHKAS